MNFEPVVCMMAITLQSPGVGGRAGGLAGAQQRDAEDRHGRLLQNGAERPDLA